MSLRDWSFSQNEQREWQGVHENYDGLPDGNNHLFVTGATREEVVDLAEEITA